MGNREMVIDNALVLFGRHGRLGTQIQDFDAKKGAGTIRNCHLDGLRGPLHPRFLQRRRLHRFRDQLAALYAAKTAWNWAMEDRVSGPPEPLIQARFKASSVRNTEQAGG